VKVENKRDKHSESKHQQGLIQLQKQQGQELEQLKQEQQQRASAREQWEQEAAQATAGGSVQGGVEQLSPSAGGGAGASANQGAQQQQQGQPNNGGHVTLPGVKLEPVDQGTCEDTPSGVFVGTAVRRKFPGYGWYDGAVRRARSAGTSAEFEVEWEDGSRAWIKQGDAQKYAARYAQGTGAGAGAGAGANRGAGSGARGSF
jgi:hypothetical protein